MSATNKISLTHDQRVVMARFMEFLNGTENVFILRGYAGTGKTTIVKEMIKLLNSHNASYHLLASTGRAAKILHDASNEQTSTVHSCIYKYVDFNQDLEKVVKERERTGVDSSGQLLLQFSLNPISEDEEGTRYYIVDEASMISDIAVGNETQATFGSGRLLKDLLSYDPSGKFLFIGDTCQLPPVGQAISPALSSAYLQATFNMSTKEVSLTQIMRQKEGNDIVFAAQKLRELYDNPQPWKWAKFPLLGYKNIHLLSSQAELIFHYVDRVKKYGYNDSTMICFSNRQCVTSTKILRPMLGFQDPQLQPGDLLLVTQNNLLSGLMNGDLVKVVSVQFKEQRAGLTFLDVSLKELVTGREISQLMIADILYANQTNLSQPQQKELFVDFFIRMKKLGFKQNSLPFNLNMQQDPYLNALRAIYGFALTCHKTQGGEWDNIFLDIPRNLPLIEKPYVYQWMYTAVTRAKKELYLVNDFYLF